MTSIRESIILITASLLAAFAGGFLATNGRIEPVYLWPITVAALGNLCSLLPAVVIRNHFFRWTFRHLMALAWRFPIALSSLLLIPVWDGLERKCFLWALLTCYFVTLPLESWLQIRRCGESNASSRPL